MESAAITKLGVQPHHSSPSTSSIQTPPGSSGKHGSTGSSSDGDHHTNHHNHHHNNIHHTLMNAHQPSIQQQQQQHQHSSTARQRSANVLQSVSVGVGVGKTSSGGYMNVNNNDDQSSGLTTTTMTNSINKSHPFSNHHGSHHNSSSNNNNNCGGRFLLGVLFTIAELLLFSCVTIWLYWSYQHDDGLAWNQDRKQQFNLHAALMLFGFVFLNGQAMLVYRSFQCCNKIYTKILHTILFVLSTSAISLGVILAYSAQENVGIGNKPIMHFYSLHAWIGLVTVGLFVFQVSLVY